MKEEEQKDRPQAPRAAEPEVEVGSSLDTDLSDVPTQRKGRHPMMMLLVIIFSGVLMWLYWDDLVYFTRPGEPRDLGSTMSLKDRYEENHNFDAGFPHNSFVSISGLTGLRTAANNGEWTFLKLAYAPVYVQVGPEQSSTLDPDQTLYLTVSGRLRHIALTSRYDRLQDYYRTRFGVSFLNAYILEVGQGPSQFWWAPLLLLLFAAFIGVNLFLLVRNLARR